MEKRLALAVALCIGFLILWSYLFPTAPPPPAAGGAPGATAEGTPGSAPVGAAGAAPSATAGESGAAGATSTAATALQPAAAPGAEAIAAASDEEITLDLPQATVRLTNRGARVRSWILKNYRDHKGQPLDLVSPAAAKLDRLPLDLLTDDPALDERLRKALFKVERQETATGAEATTVLTFRWSNGNGDGATKVLRAGGPSGLVEISASASAQGRAIDPAIAWGAGFEEEVAEASERMGVGVRALLGRGGKVERRFQSKITPAEPWTEEGSIDFAGIESKYFAAVFVPPQGAPARMRAETLRLVEDGREHLHLGFSLRPAAGAQVALYAGPKSYEVLRAAGLGLDRLLDFGFFGFIAHPLFEALRFLHRYTGNYGWAIVLLTVFIRALFFPFLHRSQLKMRQMQEKMKRIQPKLKSLKERYHRLEQKAVEKGTAGGRQKVRQEMNEEMMKLYQEEGMNPFSSVSGCLPLLAQMPILAAFYTILSISIELRQAPFVLWVHDLSEKDIALVILMSASMLAQQLMTASSIPDPAQRRMMYLMPIMFTIFFVNMPSGLVLYWLVNNLLGIVQQYLVNKEADAQARAAAAAPAS
ncbi:MAG TPA: membrane protein insertase YidC [Candidatus Polarisedimenticolia bacterium]|jgi:YidC/Oxa1 family membrane protein insertase|nr:membrane protein insertase YidC [Candidatus Polarisedimenticolia bacterium]